MDLVLQQPIPYKSLDFMHRYLQLYYSLNQKQKWALFWPLFAILAFKIVQYLLLAVYEPPSTLEKLLTNDILRLAGLPPETNLAVVGNLLLAAFYLYLSYLNTGRATFPVDILAGILTDSKAVTTSFFISSRRASFACAIKKGLLQKSKLLLLPYLRRLCRLVLLLLQVFIVAIGNRIQQTSSIISFFKNFFCRPLCSNVFVLRYAGSAWPEIFSAAAQSSTVATRRFRLKPVHRLLLPLYFLLHLHVDGHDGLHPARGCTPTDQATKRTALPAA